MIRCAFIYAILVFVLIAAPSARADLIGSCRRGIGTWYATIQAKAAARKAERTYRDHIRQILANKDISFEQWQYQEWGQFANRQMKRVSRSQQDRSFRDDFYEAQQLLADLAANAALSTYHSMGSTRFEKSRNHLRDFLRWSPALSAKDPYLGRLPGELAAHLRDFYSRLDLSHGRESENGQRVAGQKAYEYYLETLFWHSQVSHYDGVLANLKATQGDPLTQRTIAALLRLAQLNWNIAEYLRQGYLSESNQAPLALDHRLAGAAGKFWAEVVELQKLL
ncbi:MAG: hypothetical protein H6624_11660 [Bdellovibrionaceae bacterium]|nr:hypothetical protein [Bdellovibrionales bacterium]MCB9084996.1 hypothetical protein [Pseudobdellovibrionaceae bacterium]